MIRIRAGSQIVVVTAAEKHGVINPGAAVTVGFALKNVGTSATTNLVATLQPTGGVSTPSGPQSYGALSAGGPATSKPFSFVASGSCGWTKPGSPLGSTGSEKGGYPQKGELRRSWKLPVPKAVLGHVGDELPDLGSCVVRRRRVNN